MGRPWESISMDNLGPVPKSASGKDMILIVIDRLTKMARFISTYSSIASKGPILARSISASWTTIQYCIRSRPPFYSKVLGSFTESIRCTVTDVNRRTSPDWWTVWSCCQGNSEAVETLCVSGTGLGRIVALPRICLQWHSISIYRSDSFLFKLRTSPNRCYSAWNGRQSTCRGQSTILATSARSRPRCNKRCIICSTSECG